jgi:hypothetical protein
VLGAVRPMNRELGASSGELSATWIAATYGGFVSLKDLSHLLSFPSVAALRRAHQTGRLAVPIFQIQGRRGLFARAEDVSAYLRSGGAAVPGTWRLP